MHADSDDLGRGMISSCRAQTPFCGFKIMYSTNTNFCGFEFLSLSDVCFDLSGLNDMEKRHECVTINPIPLLQQTNYNLEDVV